VIARFSTLAACAAFLVQVCSAADLTGEWVAEVTSAGESQYARVTLHTEGGKLAGAWGTLTVDASVTGDRVQISLGNAGRPAGTLTGFAKGAEISGDGSMPRGRNGGGPAESQNVVWKLTRPATPPGAPKAWDFEPKVFYSYYSAQNPVALRVFPGDTVRTWTVDAGGLSAKLERLSRGGDATTGPFYVEGALPGDTLVVKINKLRPNRDHARQGNRINTRAILPSTVAAAKYATDFDSEWRLDREKGVATLAHPTEALKNFVVPIHPMLGCIAVAPPGDEVYRGTDLGPFGGNLDYIDNGEGATLYFPVFHPGALFVLGDGHAAMGDGELTGGALETSMDVEFTVGLIKNFATPAPRSENDDYLISFGVAGSVPDAIQNATSQLADWLKKDYRLNDNEVAVLLGAVLKYEITELVDPKFDVVAKVPKKALQPLR
jgi:amidase